MLSVTFKSILLIVTIPSVVLLSVTIPIVVMLNVVLLSVVAPNYAKKVFITTDPAHQRKLQQFLLYYEVLEGQAQGACTIKITE
jgi:hypothetical protein